MRCKVRARSAAGAALDSDPYEFNRGGAQGSVLMPLLFILLSHYLYKRHDAGRVGIYGAGEHDVGRRMPRCVNCEVLYPAWEYKVHDGFCRPCQIISAVV